MEPIKGITECDKSQEQAQLTRDAAIQWILKQVKTDRTEEIQFDVSKIDENPQHKTYDLNRSSKYVDRLAHLFALSEVEISKLDRDQLGYVFEVM